MLTLYTKPGCVPCKETKKFLNERGIEYFENDLAQPEVLEEFRAAFPNIRQAPAVFEDGEYIGGYTDVVVKYGAKRLLEE